MSALDKATRLNVLYDYYQSLLTEKQRQYMELYYHDDLSLGEIAGQHQVSRQAVYEHLKRAESLLEQYEHQLQMVSRHEQRTALIEQLSGLLQEAPRHDISHIQAQAEELLNLLKAID